MYAISTSNLGNLYIEKEEYLKAYRSFYESLEKFRTLGIKKSEARILFSLGKLFVLVEEFDIGLKYLKKSKEVYKECSSHNMYTKITGEHENALALIHYSKGEYETALEYVKKGIPKLLKKNDISSLQESYLIASKSYRELNQNEYAIEFIEKKIEIDNSFDNQSDKITGLVVKASILLDSDLKKSTKLAEEALQLVNKDSVFNFDQILDLYDILYKTYKRSNKPKLAMSMLENYRVCRDSLESEKFNLKIAKEAIKNEYNDRIRLAEQKNKIEQQEHKRQIKGMIFISSFVLILIFVYFRFKQIQNKRNLEILLSEIKYLKKLGSSEILLDTKKFKLDKLKIDKFIERKLNETDWKVLNILVSNPMITNKGISEDIYMSLEGINSSLRRMYQYFNIENTKYKKVALIHKVIKISNK
jgi:tetratricopeptide (TPR) repeat protein